MVKKLLSVAIGSALLSGGAVYGATLDSAEVTTLKAEKSAILQDNIWKDVRLGEIPEWDMSIVTAEEMTEAYAKKANEKGAKTDPNLWSGLREKALQEGVTCVK